MVPLSRRGTAYGIYNMTVGLVSLPASIIAGFLWDKIDPAAPFYFGAIIAGISAILLFFFVMLKKKSV
jgi:MFS family permease